MVYLYNQIDMQYCTSSMEIYVYGIHPIPPTLQVPRGPGSPPVPVMHSPPRSISAKEQVDWKIPPSISNWKVRRRC